MLGGIWITFAAPTYEPPCLLAIGTGEVSKLFYYWVWFPPPGVAIYLYAEEYYWLFTMNVAPAPRDGGL